ncbi:MAG TPA: hypothetical protein VMX13_05645 [Sedimentisphaerales bacterium]|nr:hypothetical protein [Sedimentisphaerales bacterium]
MASTTLGARHTRGGLVTAEKAPSSKADSPRQKVRDAHGFGRWMCEWRRIAGPCSPEVLSIYRP